MKFSIKNFKAHSVEVGAEPWGHYVALEPGQTIEIDTDEIEDIAIFEDSIGIFCKSRRKLMLNGEVICDY